MREALSSRGGFFACISFVWQSMRFENEVNGMTCFDFGNEVEAVFVRPITRMDFALGRNRYLENGGIMIYLTIGIKAKEVIHIARIIYS